MALSGPFGPRLHPQARSPARRPSYAPSAKKASLGFCLLSQGALWCLLWPPVICRGCSLTAAPQRLYSQVRLQRSGAVRSEPQKGAQLPLPMFAFLRTVYHND